MEWTKKHVDTVLIIGAVVGAALWMNNSTHSLEMSLRHDMGKIKEEVAIIKTVLIMKNIMPQDLATKEEGE